MTQCFLCTAKLRRELGVKDKELSEVDPNPGPLSGWYADLIRIGPKKSVIFVHPETRYILVALDRKRPDIKALSELFRDLFWKVLLAEGVEEPLIHDILGESEEARILKTTDKSVLGTMTEMVRTTRWEFDHPEKVVRDREVALSLKLSDTPIVSLKYHFPYEKLSELLHNHYGFAGEFSRERGISFSVPAFQEENHLSEGVSSLRAERLWRSISKDLQRRILQAVWCGECSTSREIVDFKLLVRNDMVILEGSCANCGGPCVRVIEED